MENSVIEAQYPVTFRKQEAEKLGQHLKNRHNVVLIGMKRVGISNFLRFFLYHKNIVKTYIGDEKNHLFISVDLNDLIERELFAFWTLTLKRIVDTVEKSTLDAKLKKEIEMLFLNSIQSQDLFLKIDNVRKALIMLVDHGVHPTFFFLRFDRIKDVVTPEFFDNLQGLRDAAHQKLSYVFTSFRSLDRLSPSVFTRQSLLVFSHDMHIPTASEEDMKIVYETYRKHYNLAIASELERALFDLVGGYIQYLQLALILLHEQKELPETESVLIEQLLKDERISLQSEELWESLDSDEQSILMKAYAEKPISEEDRSKGKYLWETGFLRSDDKVFSPLFERYLSLKDNRSARESIAIEFTKKEHLLFQFLQQNANEIGEREKIVEAVWPEVEAVGISDWAIDRLVARVRQKLKAQKSHSEIQTIKTRGYKLVQTA